MSKVEQYCFNCMIATKNQTDMLHIEVKSLKFKEQCYFQHFRYEELPQNIRTIFKNLAQVFVFLERKQMVYFDQEEEALKLCLNIAGQIKEFPINLLSHNKSAVIKQKITAFEQEKTKINEDFYLTNIEKSEKLQLVKQQLEKIQQQRTVQQNVINQDNQKCIQLQTQIERLRQECENKMSILRQINPKQSQVKLLCINDFKRHQERKKFWLEQIGKLRKERSQKLQQYINKRVNFEEQTKLIINGLKLSKMLFVEIFLNLQVLDLSNNSIRLFQGLSNLKQLLKLRLTHNKIQVIPPLPKFEKLLQLIVDFNMIKKIENVFHLTNLQILNLSSNKIQVVPDEISKLNRLVQLRLYQNSISKISEKVLLLKNIKVFSVNYIVKNRCYGQGNKGREIINKLMKNGVKTAIEEIEQINITE